MAAPTRRTAVLQQIGLYPLQFIGVIELGKSLSGSYLTRHMPYLAHTNRKGSHPAAF